MADIRSRLEYTQLHPLITAAEVDTHVQTALSEGIAALALPPYWTKKASRELGPTPVELITPVGYPLGYQRTEAKLAELELAFADGTDSIDLIINLSAFKSGCLHWVKAEIARFAHWIHARERLFTVTADLHWLDENEIPAFCKLSADAGADFVKNATAYGSENGTPALVRRMKNALPATTGVKIWTSESRLSSVQALLDAGADRVCIPSLRGLAPQPGVHSYG
jgi:deoxyribose-phosphate aldolase